MPVNKLTSGSWKTTIIGIITSIAAFVAFAPQLFSKWPWVHEISAFIMAGGMAAFGFAAKDSNVTGGTTANPNNNPTIVEETAKTAPAVPPLPPTPIPSAK